MVSVYWLRAKEVGGQCRWEWDGLGGRVVWWQVDSVRSSVFIENGNGAEKVGVR